MRLNRYLAAAGVGSRRKCDELIATGRVKINGEVCANFSAQPGPRDHVKVDGKLVHIDQPLTIVLHKPPGFVCTKSDPHARDTIFDLLPPKLSRLFNIGRLDAQSEGLLVLTNDGKLAQRLTHPRFQVPKEYHVLIRGPLAPPALAQLRQGIDLEEGRTAPATVEILTAVLTADLDLTGLDTRP